jgi:hypothetical protein
VTAELPTVYQPTALAAFVAGKLNDLMRSVQGMAVASSAAALLSAFST